MQPLEQWQASFMTMLTGGADFSLGASREPAGQGLAIYRRNYRENHIQALVDTFGNVVKLVGRNYFRQLGLRYLANYPSHSGDLNDYGEHFADFLGTTLINLPGGDALSYLPDMARLDWACMNALRAPRAGTQTLTELMTWSPSNQEQARFRLHPACMLLCSDFPLHSLWRLGSDGTSSVDLAQGGESILICRPGNDVEIHRMDAETLYFLEHWQSNTLGKSLASLMHDYPNADPGTIFANLNRFDVVGELWRQP